MSNAPVVSKSEIDAINNANQTTSKFGVGIEDVPVTYTASESEFTRMTFSQAQQLMGVHQESMNHTPTMQHSLGKLDATRLPASFDCRKAFPGKLAPIRNQAQCGSCWAESSTEVLSSRLAIQSNGKCTQQLSAQPLVSCALANGCMGNTLEAAWNYLAANGTTTTRVNPYTSGGGDPGQCEALVQGETYHAKLLAPFSDFTITPHQNLEDNITSIKQSLLSGPVQVAFQVTSPFMAYANGVFSYQTDVNHKILGGHAVMLIGWDSDNIGEYWIVQNSWGTNWGEGGFFRMRMLTPGTGYTAAVIRKGIMTFESNACVGAAILPSECQPSPLTFDCVGLKCLTRTDGSGKYKKIEDCLKVCGGPPPPVPPHPPVPPPPVPPSPKKGLTKADIIGIILGSVVVLAIIITVSVLATKKHRTGPVTTRFDEA